MNGQPVSVTPQSSPCDLPHGGDDIVVKNKYFWKGGLAETAHHQKTPFPRIFKYSVSRQSEVFNLQLLLPMRAGESRDKCGTGSHLALLGTCRVWSTALSVSALLAFGAESFFVAGTILCVLGCSAASLASTLQMPAAPALQG